MGGMNQKNMQNVAWGSKNCNCVMVLLLLVVFCNVQCSLNNVRQQMWLLTVNVKTFQTSVMSKEASSGV